MKPIALALEIWRLDENAQPFVLEVNPLPGMHPTHSDLPMIATDAGMSYVELFDEIVKSAMQRIE